MRTYKRLTFLLVTILGLAGVVVAVAPGTVFDLDGNSALEHGLPDWNQLNGTTGFNGSPGGSLVRTFVASENPPKIFTQGGSKDPNNSTGWRWKAADTVPDKDTITNAYAAEYVAPGSGHEIFVFGGERFAVNGDSNIGVWFFQQNIVPLTDGTFGPGQHQNGDIFAVSAFTTGGTNPTISVYKWNTACTKAIKNPLPAIVNGVLVNTPPNTCADTNLELQFASASGSSCILGSSDTACAATNATGPITVSWPYASKFGGSNSVVPTGGFFEGGIDITELFGGIPGNEPCISSFLMETRSSQTPDAVLKDFIGGGFNTCGEIIVHKDCNCDHITADGTAYQYSVGGTVTNTGQFTVLYDVVVSDSAGLTCPIGTVAAGATVAWGNGTAKPCSPSNSFTSTAKPASNTATVTWSRNPGGTTLGPNSSGLVTCDVSAAMCQANPGILITKVCTAGPVANNGRIDILVNFSGLVSNQGNVPLHNVSVCEDDDANNPPGTCDQIFNIGDLAAKGLSGDSAPFSGTYYPSVLNLVSPGRASFSDTVKVTATSSLAGSVTNTATATCLLCPPGSAACPAP